MVLMDHATASKAAYAIALALVVTCAAIDWRTRRIPNALTLPAIVLGFALYGLADGVSGLAFSGVGLALGAGVFFLPYFLGGMGAGDVKLMGAVGALLGWKMALVALFYIALAGGLVAILTILKARAVKSSYVRMSSMLQILLASKRMPSADSLGGDSLTIPYAVPIALGVVAARIFGSPL
jgi:prepilin peptidase CpaA